MNDSAQHSCSSIRIRALLIFGVIFFSYAYFYEGGGWNQNSRFDLVRAIVEQGTLRIDAYDENTERQGLRERPLLFGQGSRTRAAGGTDCKLRRDLCCERAGVESRRRLAAWWTLPTGSRCLPLLCLWRRRVPACSGSRCSSEAV